MLFPPASPVSPLAFTGVVGAVQGIALLSILSVIVQEIINKRKQKTCGEPPSNIGDFVLIGKQGDAAFYECPGIDVFQHDLTPTCPIIYCQDDGNYSTPVFQPDITMCDTRKSPNSHSFSTFVQMTCSFKHMKLSDRHNVQDVLLSKCTHVCTENVDVRYEVIQSTSGEITSPNYPSNYNPSSTSTTAVWNIMVPGKNLKFKIEDLDIDQSTEVILLCGLGSIVWLEENEETLIGSEFTCNKPCAKIVLFHGNLSGGRGFKISFTSDE